MRESPTLHDLFVDELKDSYDHEKQLVKALRKMSKAATHPDLAKAFASHLDETTGHIALLEEVFDMLDMKPKGKHCAGIAGIIEEGSEAIEEHDKSPLLDAALVGGGKRAEHYEIAAYTTLIAMAKELGLTDAVGRFEQILQQEIACDQKLDGFAAMLFPLANNAGEDMNDSTPELAAKKTPAKKGASKTNNAKRNSAATASARRR